MNIVTIPVGYLATNCYFLLNDLECIIVDPGDDSAKLLDIIDKYNFDVKAILLTHNHQDHIGALDDLLTLYKVKVYNRENLKEGNISIEGFNLEVIYTPGHTSDSVTYYFKDDKLMLTGDFLFRDTIGRYDLETSNFIEMKNSIAKIKEYDDNIDICPGHGRRTKLGYEKENNNYFKTY